MEFLVEIESLLPSGDESQLVVGLLGAERARARELSAQGFIKANWIVPGRKGRITLWEVADATQLHQLLSSFKTFEWSDVKVTPLVPRGPQR
jgi:muconolactone D-isomerase